MTPEMTPNTMPKTIKTTQTVKTLGPALFSLTALRAALLIVGFLLNGLLLGGCADMRVAEQAMADGDLAKAKRNYGPLAEFGLPEAQFAYARLLLDEPDEMSQAKARRYLEKAYAQGNARAEFALARLYQDGVGGPIEATKAEMLYKRLLAKGDMRAAIKLGDLYTDQNEIALARAAYLRAYRDGNPKAAERLGDLAAKYTIPPDHQGALTWYKRARAAGVEGAAAKVSRQEKHLRPAPPKPKAKTSKAKKSKVPKNKTRASDAPEGARSPEKGLQP